MRFYTFLAICIYALPSIAGAQPLEEEPVTIDFRVYLWPKFAPVAGIEGTTSSASDNFQQQSQESPSAEIPPDERFVAPEISYASGPDGNVTDLKLQEGQLSVPYRYSGPPLMSFFRRVTTSNGIEERIPLTNLTLNPNERSINIFLFPKVDKSFFALPIPDNLSKAPDHTVMVLNLTPNELTCALGDVRFHLSPASNKTLHINPEDQAFYQTLLVASPASNGELRKRMARLITLMKGRNWILVLYNRTDSTDGISLQKVEVSKTKLSPSIEEQDETQNPNTEL